jgi:hypothetical protein
VTADRCAESRGAGLTRCGSHRSPAVPGCFSVSRSIDGDRSAWTDGRPTTWRRRTRRPRGSRAARRHGSARWFARGRRRGFGRAQWPGEAGTPGVPGTGGVGHKCPSLWGEQPGQHSLGAAER